MKVVVQRVTKANVKVKDKIIGEIGNGVLLLVGFKQNDNFEVIKYMANKIINLRIFDDEKGIMNLSLKDKNYEILSVSQFTLYGDASKGNRPSYIMALNHEEAVKLFDLFNEELKKSSLHIETGIFREDMQVSLTNNGPVTIIIEK